jgi:hypothetical protein
LTMKIPVSRLSGDQALLRVWIAPKQRAAVGVCLRRVDTVQIAILAQMGSYRSADPI